MGTQGVDGLLSLFGDLPEWPGGTPPKNRGPKKQITDETYGGAKPKSYRINGKDVQMFTVGQLALAVDRKAVTIRSWEKQGIIPRATYRTPPPVGQQLPGKPPKGRRLYSQAQVDLILEAITTYKIGTKTPDWVGFSNHIKTHWNES